MSDATPPPRRLARHAPLALALALTACGDDPAPAPVREPDPTDGAPAALRRAVDAMGGWAVLGGAVSETVEATGQRFHAASGPRPGVAAHVSDYAATLRTELEGDRLRLDIEHTTRYLPLPAPLSYAQVIDGQGGYVAGVDSLFGPQPVDPAPMLSSRLAAGLKQADLASPLRLIRRALAPPSAPTVGPDEAFEGRPHAVLNVTLAGGLPARLFVDAATGLLSKAETVEDHPPLGDSLVEAVYADYRPVGVPGRGEIMLPFRVTVAVDGVTALSEVRGAVRVNDPAEVDYAVPGGLLGPFDEALGDFGRRRAQWLIGFEHLGFAFFHNDQSAAPVALNELAPGVYHVTGPSHHQLLVEMSDHLVLVDAPLYEGRAAAVLAEIKRAFPAKPIRHIVATHFHYDHSGGVRHFAAEGGVTVWAGGEGAPFFRRALDNPHTVSPDRLQQSPVDVAVEPVGALHALTDGARRVELHRVATGHAEDMLAVYLPGERILFNADLFSPGDVPPLDAVSEARARDLDDAVTRLGLDVAQIAGGHGDGTATPADLRAAAGR